LPKVSLETERGKTIYIDSKKNQQTFLGISEEFYGVHNGASFAFLTIDDTMKLIASLIKTLPSGVEDVKND
jgi:hypothetical protein